LVWFGDDIENMRLEGVSVSWGNDYRTRNKLNDKELIDLTSIFFE